MTDRARCPNCGDVFDLTDEWTGYTCSQECWDEYVAYVEG